MMFDLIKPFPVRIWHMGNRGIEFGAIESRLQQLTDWVC